MIDGTTRFALPLPEASLPLGLPEVKSYQPTGTGESPLAGITDWLEIWYNPPTGASVPASQASPGAGWIRGRGYRSDDANWIQQVGLSAGYMSVLVLALYVTAPEITVLYRQPKVLWLLCPLLLYWLTRLWLRAGRGLVHDDPIIDAMSDRTSYIVAVVGAVIAAAAI